MVAPFALRHGPRCCPAPWARPMGHAHATRLLMFVKSCSIMTIQLKVIHKRQQISETRKQSSHIMYTSHNIVENHKCHAKSHKYNHNNSMKLTNIKVRTQVKSQHKTHQQSKAMLHGSRLLPCAMGPQVMLRVPLPGPRNRPGSACGPGDAVGGAQVDSRSSRANACMHMRAPMHACICMHMHACMICANRVNVGAKGSRTIIQPRPAWAWGVAREFV